MVLRFTLSVVDRYFRIKLSLTFHLAPRELSREVWCVIIVKHHFPDDASLAAEAKRYDI